MPNPLLNTVNFLAKLTISLGEFHSVIVLCGEKNESSNVHIWGLTAHTLSGWTSQIDHKTIEQDLLVNTGETPSAVR